MRGSSQPLLVRTSDRRLYVIKLLETAAGPNALFNEVAGTELYRLAGLLVPEWRPLVLPKAVLQLAAWSGLVDSNGPQNATICFGSHFLGQDGASILEILPGTFHRRIVTPQVFWVSQVLDCCANHCDNRQALFRGRADCKLDVFFIDHGHMLGGPDGTRQAKAGAAAYLDSRIYPDLSRRNVISIVKMIASLPSRDLWKHANQLPTDWKTETGVQNLKCCCSNLSDPQFLTDCLDKIAHSSKGRNFYENDADGLAIQRGGAFLHRGVQ